jgi:hypothetical protein
MLNERGSREIQGKDKIFEEARGEMLKKLEGVISGILKAGNAVALR